jgi:uncharacterized protein YcfJ
MNELIELGRAAYSTYEFKEKKATDKRYAISGALTSPVTASGLTAAQGGMLGGAVGGKKGAAIGALAGGALGYAGGKLSNKISRRGEIHRANKRKAKGKKQYSELRGARY